MEADTHHPLFRVLLCCESSLMADGLRALLAQQDDVEIVGDVTQHSVLAAARERGPDVVVILAPALTIEHDCELAALAALSKVVLIARGENVRRAMEAVRLGVRAVVAPDSSALALLQTLRTVYDSVALLDLDGKPISVTPRGTHFAAAGTDWFAAAAAGQEAVGTPARNGNGIDMMLAAPVMDGRRVVRVLAVDLDLSRLYGFVSDSRLGRSGTSLLVSPAFVFRMEAVEADPAGGQRLDVYSLATRISFLLWDAPPDEALLDAAADGSLRTPQGLERQVDRMMASPRLEQGVRAFFSDMLGFDQFAALQKDQAIYPKYNSLLSADAQEQVLRAAADARHPAVV